MQAMQEQQKSAGYAGAIDTSVRVAYIAIEMHRMLEQRT